VPKSEQVAVIVGEGKYCLHFLLSSTGTMIKKDPPRFILSPGQIGITKCQYNGVVVGLDCSEVGLVSDHLGWNRSWSLTAMVQVVVEVIRNIVIITFARGNIRG